MILKLLLITPIPIAPKVGIAMAATPPGVIFILICFNTCLSPSQLKLTSFKATSTRYDKSNFLRFPLVITSLSSLSKILNILSEAAIPFIAIWKKDPN